MLTSGGVRDMPSWRVSVSAEFRENHRQQWDAAPWLWAQGADRPAPQPPEDEARALIAQGRVSDACALCGVHLGEGLRRLAAGLPLARFAPPQPAWVDELHSALRQLAPWRLAAGLARIQARLQAANQKPPKPGSWERKLLWFSGQRSASRRGVGVRQGERGPVLDVIATASNALFPVPDWQDVQDGRG